MSWTAQMLGYVALQGAIDEFVNIELKDDAVYVVGPSVGYAVFQEYGTRYHPPQPYMRPAAEEAQNRIGDFVAQEGSVSAGVEKTALFVERRAKELAPVDTGQLRSSITTEKVQG